MLNKPAQASIQLLLILFSTFAFAYIIGQSEKSFEDLSKKNIFVQQSKLGSVGSFMKQVVVQIFAPIFPIVSAAATGCCSKTLDNRYCSYTSSDLCVSGRLFAENTQCEQTSFCKIGCCIDDDSGTCDKNTVQSQCEGTWLEDKNCNVPQCEIGCCNLGDSGITLTEKQCEVYTERFVLGENKQTSWDSTISEVECIIDSLVEVKGACLTSTSEEKNNCRLTTNKECLSLTGSLENFVEGKLCTSPELNTVCEKTKETTCVDGKDEVYFLDSCGNPANIYDSSRLDDYFYWDNIVPSSNSCNVENGGANSKDCGNCDRFKGGKCSSVKDSNFEVTEGDYYCKETSCIEGGVEYQNGESWCVYDGKIGEGDDIVGSRHWRHICNLGEVLVEPCADYRAQVCVQQDVLSVDGQNITFKQSSCQANQASVCIGYNADLSSSECKSNPFCFMQGVQVGDFSFNYCVPQYPKGSGDMCSLGSQTCTVYYQKSASLKWVCKQNCECERSDEFVKQMNDYCISLGDCGGYINTEGKYSARGYSTTRTQSMPSSKIQEYQVNQFPVDGLFAKPISSLLSSGAILSVVSSGSMKDLRIRDKYLTKDDEGRDPVRFHFGAAFVTWAPAVMWMAEQWFGVGKVKTKTVTFTCQPWVPPVGGIDCSKCNDDPTKPCSEYRCESLGAACQLLNKGEEDEMCEAIAYEPNPPQITKGVPEEGVIFEDTSFGYKVRPSEERCVRAYDSYNLTFVTDEPAQCRYSIEQIDRTDYENMTAFGSDSFIFEHKMPFYYPDPSHGVSQGLNFSSDLNVYIICMDVHGNLLPMPYKIETCVNQGQDITPPMITRTEPATNSLLAFNISSTKIVIYTNEPSSCKWSKVSNDSFASMTNELSCEQSMTRRSLYGYVCNTTLPIDADQNSFYFSCQDQPWLEGTENQSNRNAMSPSSNENVDLNRVESRIKIDNIVPTEDLKTETTKKTMTLGLQTSGGAKQHTCYYSFSGYDNLVRFLVTGERVHKQELNPSLGTYKIYLECRDETGDKVRGETNFRIIQDLSAPKVARVFKEGSTIKIITDEEAECRYSTEKCGFSFLEGLDLGSGKIHTINSKGGEVYYIKCKDEWGNAPSSCSITVQGT